MDKLKSKEIFLRESFREENIEKTAGVSNAVAELSLPILYPDSRQRSLIYLAMENHSNQQIRKEKEAMIKAISDLNNSERKSDFQYAIELVLKKLNSSL